MSVISSFKLLKSLLMKLPVGVNCDTNDIKRTVHKQNCNFCRNGLKKPIEPPLQEVTSTKCCLTIENKTYEKVKEQNYQNHIQSIFKRQSYKPDICLQLHFVSTYLFLSNKSAKINMILKIHVQGTLVKSSRTK